MTITCFQIEMQKTLSKYPNLRLVEASVEDIRLEESSGAGRRSVCGIIVNGGEVMAAKQVVVTTGTFLRGHMQML